MGSIYITINDRYLVRYGNIRDGKLKMNLIEERNGKAIRKLVSTYVLRRDTIVTGGVVNITHHYSSNDDILYYLPVDVLKKWFHSRCRGNTEADMVIFLYKYNDLHPDRTSDIEKYLVPGIKLSSLATSHSELVKEFCTKYDINVLINYGLFEVYLPTYQYILYKLYTNPTKRIQLINAKQISRDANVCTNIGEGIKLSSILTVEEFDIVFSSIKHGVKSLEYALTK